MSSSPAEGDYDAEFRSHVDDAWYSVSLLAEGNKLRVRFLNFPDSHDAVYDALELNNEASLKDLKGRIRKLSAQLQDGECSNVLPGTLVCASHSFGPNDVRFYDAVVEGVQQKTHSFAKGEEECLCNFLLCWQHGPNAGKLSMKSIENICVVQSSAEIEPSFTAFVKMVNQKMNNGTSISCSCSGNNLCATNHDDQHQENVSPNVKQKSTFAQRLTVRKGPMCSLNEVQPSDGRCRNLQDENRQDTDIGGVKKYHAILVQNVEKDLSPTTVLKFIRQQTSLTPQVYILPSLKWESYTKAAIVLDCEKDLEQLYDFLQNPHHIIISSTGKPWVVAEKMSGIDVGLSKLNSFNKLLDTSGGICEELKVVCCGTEEFKRVAELRDLFIEFACYQQKLHQKLHLEERNILYPF
ncbi:hypothetical protein SLA2020_456600 [Shorea laevis]